MNEINATGQAFFDILFAQLHGFRFICLLQPKFFIVIDGMLVILSFITYFIITQLSLKDYLGKIYIEILDLFPTKLG